MLLGRHDFSVEQVKLRVLGNFDNMEESAEHAATEMYGLIGSMPDSDRLDWADVAEAVRDHRDEFYMMLNEMKVQTTLGALALIYHQWDKDFRTFMERELSRFYDRDGVTKFCWQSNIGILFDTLEEFGWVIREASWFPLINQCRLIVNVYKHGKGSSLYTLAKEHPEYLGGPFDDINTATWLQIADYRHLSITQEEFDQITDALRLFWVELPENLSLPEAK